MCSAVSPSRAPFYQRLSSRGCCCLLLDLLRLCLILVLYLRSQARNQLPVTTNTLQVKMTNPADVPAKHMLHLN
ncbi:hypothetical protein QVD17_27722 [Tagetes erecta]|uniref:Uncharacterized protein n=1 Tax=Tagetes erecta TaxID=13708 RepID=A0AAD8NRM8_TARER|nr:hypothetical protein QVD17_27722 [Tagetes erecta]